MKTAGTVMAYSVNPTNGALTFLNFLSTQGGGTPAFIVVDNRRSNVLVANYSANNVNNGGSVIVFPIQANGSLGAATALIQDPGISHAHCIANRRQQPFCSRSRLGAGSGPVFGVQSGGRDPHHQHDPHYARRAGIGDRGILHSNPPIPKSVSNLPK